VDNCAYCGREIKAGLNDLMEVDTGHNHYHKECFQKVSNLLTQMAQQSQELGLYDYYPEGKSSAEEDERKLQEDKRKFFEGWLDEKGNRRI
jgi:hypothetical protein